MVENEKGSVNIEQHENALETKDDKLAREAAEHEHALTFVQAVRKYHCAVLWSLLLSASIIMEGYDIVLISSFFAQPSFSKRYGDFDAATDSYQISASWQNGLTNAVSVGTIVGAFANGHFTQKYGYRKVLLASLILIIGFVFIPFFAPSLPVLLVGKFLCGIPWGVFATMAPAYASEVCPMALRGYLTVWVNMCWALGQLISAGVQAGFSENNTQWSYRIPFAVQWVWPLPLFIILFFAPESPWHYVRAEDYVEAEKSVMRLSSVPKEEARKTVAMMVHTNELEKSIAQGTSYLDCFRGVDLRRTEIVCLAFMAQPFCGSAMGGTPTYFFVQAGLPTSIVNLLRCAWAGSQKYGALVWSGDIASSWSSFRNQLAAGLNMGLAGIPWWTTDIGGFHGGDPDDDAFRELFVRWFQWGTFCPVMRLHGDREPRQPQQGATGGATCCSGADNEVWSYGPEVYEICKTYMGIREELRDYTCGLMQQAHEHGTPVMRTLFYEFPHDAKCWETSEQYMYGDKYLCCPVLEAGQTELSVYFPPLEEGKKWVSFSGEVSYEGGQTVEVSCPLNSMPVFVKN